MQKKKRKNSRNIFNWAAISLLERFYYLKEKVSQRGWEILSTENDFKTFCDKLRFRCQNGHEFEKIAYHAADPDHGCPICAGFQNSIARIGELSAKLGWTLITDKYQGPKFAYKFRCQKCGIFRNTRYHHIKNHPGCRSCRAILKKELDRICYVQRKAKVIELVHPKAGDKKKAA